MSVKQAVQQGALAGRLMAQLRARTARVAVVGLGYVGLPLAETFAWGGYGVIGFDIDADKVRRLQRGESYIGHIPGESIRAAAGRFEATHEFRRLDEPDAILICVPTPLSTARDPDLSYVSASATSACRWRKPSPGAAIPSSASTSTARASRR